MTQKGLKERDISENINNFINTVQDIFFADLRHRRSKNCPNDTINNE